MRDGGPRSQTSRLQLICLSTVKRTRYNIIWQTQCVRKIVGIQRAKDAVIKIIQRRKSTVSVNDNNVINRNQVLSERKQIIHQRRPLRVPESFLRLARYNAPQKCAYRSAINLATTSCSPLHIYSTRYSSICRVEDSTLSCLVRGRQGSR